MPDTVRRGFWNGARLVAHAHERRAAMNTARSQKLSMMDAMEVIASAVTAR
jgi:hypothetical protein